MVSPFRFLPLHAVDAVGDHLQGDQLDNREEEAGGDLEEDEGHFIFFDLDV